MTGSPTFEDSSHCLTSLLRAKQSNLVHRFETTVYVVRIASAAAAVEPLHTLGLTQAMTIIYSASYTRLF